MSLIVGLTGGIGSGKSTVSDMFAALGIVIVDTDMIARDVVAPGTPCLKAIGDHFGSEFVTAEGTLDRRLLRAKVFADPEQRAWLEALLHPVIRQETSDRLHRSDSPYTILSSPLLLQSPDAERVQRIVVVDVPEAIQLERASRRDDTTPEEVRKILGAQLSRQARLDRADDVIDNSGDLASTRHRVHQLHRHYLTLAKALRTS